MTQHKPIRAKIKENFQQAGYHHHQLCQENPVENSNMANICPGGGAGEGVREGEGGRGGGGILVSAMRCNTCKDVSQTGYILADRQT